MPNYQTGHRQEAPRISLHPSHKTARDIFRLHTDEADLQKQKRLQEATLQREQERRATNG